MRTRSYPGRDRVAGKVWAVALLVAGFSALSFSSQAVPAHAATVRNGIDVSQYQGAINWRSVASSGVSFAYIRAVAEPGVPDTKFVTNWNGARAAGVTPGAYLFFNASLDPNVEANQFISALGSVNFVRGDLTPVIDVEVMEGETSATLISRLHTLVSRMQAATGVLPAIYTAPSWWNSHVGSSDFVADPLWLACWCTTPTLPASNWGGYGYQVWQYSSNGTVPGISGRVDLDRGNPIPPTYGGKGSLRGSHLAVIDTEGNGSAALAVTDSRIYALLSTGTNFDPSVQTWAQEPFYGSRLTTFANLDGPGTPASAIAINNDSIWVMKNNSGAFGAAQPWSGSLFYGDVLTTMADVTGDGKSDVVAVNHGSIWVMRNTGAAFGAPQEWSHIAFYGQRGTYMADMTGDGKVDAVAVNNDSVWVTQSDGNGHFGSPHLWASSLFYGSLGTFVANIDGPGHGASVIALNSDSMWVEKNIGGTHLGAPQLGASHGAFYGTWNYMADVDGSGKASMIAVNQGSIWVEPNNGNDTFGSPEQWLLGAFYGTH